MGLMREPCAAIALFARFGGNDKIGELVSMLA
jgi:hypothetical protein